MITRELSKGKGKSKGTGIKRLEYMPGQMLLRIKEEAVWPVISGPTLKLSGPQAKRLPQSVAGPLEYLRKNAGLKVLQPLFSKRHAQVMRAHVPSAIQNSLAVMSSVSDSTSEQLRGITMAVLDPKKATPSLMKHLKGAKALDFVEMMPARWLMVERADPMRNLQWGLRVINWFNGKIPNAGTIEVGVMDTGIDKNHPDLAPTLAEYHHPGLKADDIIGHGTHVAGIIAAMTNNGVGISGVASCKLHVWKIFPDKPQFGDFYVDGEIYLRALREAADTRVKALNLSIGGTASSETEAILFRYLEGRGITVVAAMGNEYLDGDPTEYPAAYVGVFSVGSIAENKKRSHFSNTGKHIDLVAPGSNILSTLPTKQSPHRDETDYASWSGTSMATPHVTGAVALLASIRPQMDSSEIKQRIRETTLKLPMMKGKDWTRSYGTGLLEVAKMLADD